MTRVGEAATKESLEEARRRRTLEGPEGDVALEVDVCSEGDWCWVSSC